MSKNLTRKGLAFGAIVALGTSLFAAAPAQAADLITLNPSAGTAYATLLTSPFTLTTSEDLSLQAATTNSQILWKVTNASLAPLSVDFGTGSANTTTNVTTVGVYNSVVTDLVTTSTLVNTSSASSFYVQPNTVATAQVGSTTSYTHTYSPLANKTVKNNLKLSTSLRTADVSVGVQAFVDANNDGVLDAGDTVSTPQTVTFYKSSNVTATTTLTQPIPGATGVGALTANVTFDKAINYNQIASGDVNVVFKKSGVGATSAVTLAANDSSAATALTASGTPSAAISNGTYSASATITDGTSQVASGVENFKAVNVGSQVIGSFGVSAVAGAGIHTVTAASGTTAGTPVAGVVHLRAGVKAATVVATVKDTASTPAIVAGVTVNAVVTAANINSTDGVTVNGVAIKDTTPVNVTGVTDASGNFTLNIATLTGVAADQLSIVFSATDSASVKTSATTVVSWTDATSLQLISDADALYNQYRTVAVGGSYTASYSVVDEYGSAVADGTYRVTLTPNSARNVSWALAQNVVGGKAAFTVVDNGIGSGTNVVTATLQKVSDASSVGSPVVTNIVYNSDATPGSISLTVPSSATGAATTGWGALQYNGTTVDNRKALIVSDGTFANYQSTAAAGASAPAPTAGYAVTVSGSVSSTTYSAALSGAPVTIAAPGLLFHTAANGIDVWAVGSVSFLASQAGAFSFDVYSQTGGTQTVTVTSGAISKTFTLTYAASSANAKTIKLVVPTTTQVGRAVDVVATVLDSFGNGVNGASVTLSSTGPGYLNTTALTTDATGKVSAKLIIGTAETGDAVVTAAVTGSTTVTAATATVSAGSTDANIDIVNNRVTAVASFSKGKTVAFYVDGIKKWSKASASDSDVVVNYNLKKGTHTVAVKISGGFSTVEKFIVK